MTPFTTLTGAAAPLLLDDINTDQIAPQQMDRRLDPDFRAMLFRRQRQDADFVLNRPQFQSAAILVSGRNFGCGSARETAVWALTAFGIRCVVARGFADIFRENCLQNGVLPLELDHGGADVFAARVVAADGAAPFTVDLLAQRISGPGGPDIAFDIAPADRLRLIEGLDDIGLTLKHTDAIAAWELRTAAEQPWLQSARDSRR
ncbi:MAG TPA: 3-isopropylmalate dehydratase small subunit [Xanthobacteraceae bacterium]|jgi:3-isopropylmalate dehydratase small subunit